MSPAADLARPGPRAAQGPGRVGLAAVLAATALAYAPSLRGPFNFDDYAAIVARAELADPAAIAARLPAAILGESRAVTDLTFALDEAAWGVAPLPFRVTNLAIHLALVLVLYALGRALLARAGEDRPAVALAAAALFALHPLGAEAVAYVCQRYESLSSLLYAGAVVLALGAEAAAGRRRAVRYAAATLLVLAGLGAKGLTVTAFATAGLAALAFPSAPPPRRRAVVLAALPWAAAGALFAGGLAAAVHGRADAGFAIPTVAPLAYWRSQPAVLLGYARMVAFPAGQSVDHDFPPLADPLAIAASFAALGALAAAAVAGLRRSRPPAVRVAAFGVAWFLAVLAPTSVLPIVDLFVEHRAYLASFGLLLAAAALSDLAIRRALPSPRARAVGAVALLAVAAGGLGLALAARARLWGDAVALWEDAAAKAPRKVRAATNLGHARRAAGDLDGALEAFRRALDLAGPAGDVRSSLVARAARTLVDAGRAAEAEAYLSRALESDTAPTLEALVVLVDARIAAGHPMQAELAARQAAWFFPVHPAALAALARALRAQGRDPEAAAIEARAAEAAGLRPPGAAPTEPADTVGSPPYGSRGGR